MLLCLLLIMFGSLVGSKLEEAQSGKRTGDKPNKTHFGKLIGGIIGLLISASLFMTITSLKPEWMFQPETITRERATLLELSKSKEGNAEIIYSSNEIHQLHNLSYRTRAGETKHKSALKLHEEIFVYDGNSDRSNLLVITKTKKPILLHWLIFPTRAIEEEIFEVILPGKIFSKQPDEQRTYSNKRQGRQLVREKS